MTPDTTALRDLSHLDLVRSGMALQAVGSQGLSWSDCEEASWVTLAAMVAYDETWVDYLFMESGELHHPSVMGQHGKGQHHWVEWREEGIEPLVIDPLFCKFLVDGYDPRGVVWELKALSSSSADPTA